MEHINKNTYKNKLMKQRLDSLRRKARPKNPVEYQKKENKDPS